MRIDVHGLGRGDLSLLFARWGLSRVHAARLWKGLYLGCAASLEEVPELPARVRERLAAGAFLRAPRAAADVHSADGFTRKFLLALDRDGDGRREDLVETVLMRFTGRVSACVSTQAGCAMGCVFCATGQMSFQRNLTAGEIIGQALHVQRSLEPGSRLRNVVLMGMGEPLQNYDAVMKAVEILHDPGGFALGASRVTLSTVGIVPGILRLAEERPPLHLAVSLHAATQEERAALVPAARKWPLDELMEACRAYIRATGRRIFYEWTLIEGRNDSAEHARAVGRLLRGQRAQVNLIPLNPTTGYGGAPSRSEAARRFQEILSGEFGLPSTVRQRRGLDIAAGCGQLAGTG